MDEPTTQTLSIDQLERQQGLLEEEEEHGGPARARRRSRESRGSTAAGAGNTVITSGEVIQVDMSRLANVLGERGVACCCFGGCADQSTAAVVIGRDDR